MPPPHCEFVSLATGTQVLPAQHPVQLKGVQATPPVHVPPEQLCPVPQGTQVAPCAAVLPHCELVSLATTTQVFPAQQPAQLDALQPVPPVHTPPEQLCPVPHATQAAPCAAVLPQSEFVSLATVKQVLPAQQPAQLDALQAVPPVHTPPEQLCPVPQAMQVLPAVGLLPQSAVDSEAAGTQVDPRQQPEQLLGPQEPPSPDWRQLPLGPQNIPVGQVWTHWEPLQHPLQLLGVHCGVMVAHWPSSQVWLSVQLRHATPAVPHALVTLPCSHSPFESQHPEQLVGPHLVPPHPASSPASAHTATAAASP
jgi:hypothetical protein